MSGRLFILVLLCIVGQGCALGHRHTSTTQRIAGYGAHVEWRRHSHRSPRPGPPAVDKRTSKQASPSQRDTETSPQKMRARSPTPPINDTSDDPRPPQPDARLEIAPDAPSNQNGPDEPPSPLDVPTMPPADDSDSPTEPTMELDDLFQPMTRRPPPTDKPLLRPISTASPSHGIWDANGDSRQQESEDSARIVRVRLIERQSSESKSHEPELLQTGRASISLRFPNTNQESPDRPKPTNIADTMRIEKDVESSDATLVWASGEISSPAKSYVAADRNDEAQESARLNANEDKSPASPGVPNLLVSVPSGQDIFAMLEQVAHGHTHSSDTESGRALGGGVPGSTNKELSSEDVFQRLQSLADAGP